MSSVPPSADEEVSSASSVSATTLPPLPAEPSAPVPLLPSFTKPATPPRVTLTFHSSVSLLAPIPARGSLPAAFLLPSSAHPPPAAFVKPPPVPPRCFFHSRRLHQHDASPSQSSDELRLRTYRRTFPAPSLADSVRSLTWPHPPSSSSSEARAAHLASLPDADQAALTAQHFESMRSACSSLLSLLSILSLIPLRPYDLSLHVISPSSPPFSSLLTSHHVLPHLLSPLLYSLGFQRQGHSFILTASPSHVDLPLRLLHTQLYRMQAEASPGADEFGEAAKEEEEEKADMTGVFHVERAAPGLAGGEEKGEEAREEEGEEEKADPADALASPGGRRRSTIHSTTHHSRRMPSQPTRARHDRHTFKPSYSTHCPPPPRPTSPQPQTEPATTLPSARPLAANIAGDRRTLPVVLPVAFLASAPTLPSPSPSSSPPSAPRFQLQPSFLDLGPLLVGRRYEVRLWLQNVGVGYGRWRVEAVWGGGVKEGGGGGEGGEGWGEMRVGVEVRRGGLAGGLGKEVRVGVEAVGVGRVEGAVEVRGGEGELVRMEMEGEVVEDEGEWRRRVEGRRGLGMGAMGLVRTGGVLPGSLKDISGHIGRVREVRNEDGDGRREESKEQWLQHVQTPVATSGQQQS